MHLMMSSKGFRKKDAATLERIQKEKQIIQEAEDYHTYRRSMYFKTQKQVVSDFKRDVMGIVDDPNKPKQSRLQAEKDYLVDHYDEMHAEERSIVKRPMDQDLAVKERYALYGNNAERIVLKKLAALKASAREEL